MALVQNRGHKTTTQKLHRFDNGFGASVISDGYGSDDGLFEVGVIKWTGDDYSLTYTTPITRDVLGYLTAAEVESTLAQIEALDPAAVIEAHKAKRIADLEAEIAEIRAE